MAALVRGHGYGRGLAAAVLLLGGLAGCSGGEGGVALPSNRPSVERTTTSPTATASATRSERPSRETPSRDATTTAEPAPTKTTTEPRTTAPPPETTETTTEPTTTAPPRETTAAETTTRAEQTTPATTAASAVAATTADDGLGPGGWLLILVILLLVALVGVLLVNRSRRRSDWESELAMVAQDTATAIDVRLPQVLTTRTTPERALAWPPLRADLIALAARWNALAGGTSDESRQYPASQLAGLLPELVAAVDAENEALATRRDWLLLRPRVEDLEQLIGAALATFTAPATPAPDPYGPDPGDGPDPYAV